MRKDDMCQADSTAVGSDGIAPEGALQAGEGMEAEGDIIDELRHPLMNARYDGATGGFIDSELDECAAIDAMHRAANEIERLRVFLDHDFKKAAELSVKRIEYPDENGGLRLDLESSLIPLLAEHLAQIFTREGAENFLGIEFNHPELGPFTLSIQRRFGETPAAKAARLERENSELKSQIEERSDTVTAEQREAGLTQNFKSKAQEIVDNCPALGCCEYYKLIIPQALSTSYEEGRRDEAIARRLAFEEAMRAAKDPTPIPASKAYCAFCGQGDAEVGMDKLVEGPTVCICEFCVENALLVLDSRKASVRSGGGDNG